MKKSANFYLFLAVIDTISWHSKNYSKSIKLQSLVTSYDIEYGVRIKIEKETKKLNVKKINKK